MRMYIIIFLIAYSVFSQNEHNYSTDSIAVRTILDANGLDTLTVEQVSYAEVDRITDLSLINYNLTVIPDIIGDLDSLTLLCLIRNEELYYLPQTIGNFNVLEILYLGENALKDLPDSIVKLDNLSALDIRYNQLCSLTPIIKEWADKNEPGWEETQDCETAVNELNIDKTKNFCIFVNNFITSNNIITISFKISSGNNVKIEFYDIKGKSVKTLIDDYKSPGVYHVNWNAKSLGSGIFYIKLSAGDFVSVKKISIVK